MRARPAIAAVLAVTAVAAAGCGSGNDKHGIPQGDAQSMLHRLDQIDTNVSAGKCRSATAELSDLRQRAANLPSSVANDVQRALNDGIDHLSQLVQDQCQTPTQTTPTQTTPTQTTPTQTTPTQTTPTQTTPTQTTPTQTTPPPPTQTQPQPPPTTTTPGTGGTPPGQAKKGADGKAKTIGAGD